MKRTKITLVYFDDFVRQTVEIPLFIDLDKKQSTIQQIVELCKGGSNNE